MNSFSNRANRTDLEVDRPIRRSRVFLNLEKSWPVVLAVLFMSALRYWMISLDALCGDGDGQISTPGIQIVFWVCGFALLTWGVIKSEVRLLKNLWLSVSVIAAMLVMLEGFARVYAFLSPSRGLSHYQFRLSRPKPYMNSSYFSTHFVDESVIQPGGWETPNGTRLVLPKDFSGRYFNTFGGFRRTTDVPSKYSREVYLLGGSTVYCSEVPDSHTIASYLQRVLNSKYTDEFRVINCGASTVNSSQQLERLKYLSVRKDDIVIFYDGVNDIYQGIYNLNPYGWVVGENRRALHTMSLVGKVLYWLYDNLSNESEFVRRFMSPFSKDVPPHLRDKRLLNQVLQLTTLQYIANIVAADSICRSRGAFFFHFHQPSLFTKSKKSSYEFEVLSNKSLVPPGMEAAFEVGVPALRKCVDELQKRRIRSEDISDVLNSLSKDVYLDCWHVTEAANEAIAVRIAGSITSMIDTRMLAGQVK